MRSFFVFVTLALFCLSPLVLSHNHLEPAPPSEAGFKVFVASSGIDYAKSAIALPLFEDMKAKLMAENLAVRLPADVRKYSISAVGYTLTSFYLDEITITKLTFDPVSTGIVMANQAPNQLTVRVTNVQVEIRVKGRWDTRVIVISAGVNRFSLDLAVKMGKSADFKPTVEIVSGNLNLTPDMLNLKIEEGVGKILGWALDKIVNYLKPKGAQAIQEQFKAHYRTPNAQLATMLSSLVLTKTVTPKDIPAMPAAMGDNFKVTKSIVARVSLHSPPVTDAKGLTLSFDAHTYLEGESQCDASCKRRVTPAPFGPNNAYIDVQMTDYLPCCMLTAAQKLGLFNYKGKVTKPKVDPNSLPADYREGLVPLINVFLDKYEVAYAATMKNVPQVKFSKGKVSLTVKGLVATVFIDDLERTPAQIAAGRTKAVDLTVSASVAASVRVTGSHISYSLSRVTLTLDKFESFVPEITDVIKPELQNLIDVIIATKVIPMANLMLSKGFDIPVVAGMTFVNPNLALEDGFIGVRTAFTYRRPAAPVTNLELEELEEEELDVLIDQEYSTLPPIASMPITEDESGPAIQWDPTASFESTNPARRIVSRNEDDYESYIDLDIALGHTEL